MNPPNEPARQEPIRVDYRYAATPEEQAQFAKVRKGVFGLMGGIAVLFLIVFLLFVVMVAVVGYVFLHNALHLF